MTVPREFFRTRRMPVSATVPTWREETRPRVVHLCKRLTSDKFKTICGRPRYFVKATQLSIVGVNCQACRSSNQWPVTKVASFSR